MHPALSSYQLLLHAMMTFKNNKEGKIHKVTGSGKCQYGNMYKQSESVKWIKEEISQIARHCICPWCCYQNQRLNCCLRFLGEEKKKKKLMYLIQVSERTILHKDKGIKKRATVKSYFPNHVTSQKTKSRK